jgi:hypothetical protein
VTVKAARRSQAVFSLVPGLTLLKLRPVTAMVVLTIYGDPDTNFRFKSPLCARIATAL